MSNMKDRNEQGLSSRGKGWWFDALKEDSTAL